METDPSPHHSNIRAVDKESGLYCFLDKSRPCTAECMAYVLNDELPKGDEYKDRQWPRCLLLVNAHRAGKHAVVLASAVATLVRGRDDQVRTAQTPPPMPGTR